jgi:hypothetical protein
MTVKQKGVVFGVVKSLCLDILINLVRSFSWPF